jgi:prepilin peptidase CpaA
MLALFTNGLILILAALLLLAATGDLKTRIIPNWLNATIALLAIPFWWFSGKAFFPDVVLGIAIATALVLLFAIAFRVGAMGGGDVKLIGALALWLDAAAVLKLLVIMSLAGGVLTLAMLIHRHIAKSRGDLEIPYGVAISFGGFWLISERYLNHFG